MQWMFRDAPAFNQDIGSWDISALTNAFDMFLDAGLNNNNYDRLLLGWSTLDTGEAQIPQNVTFNGGNSVYCTSEAERNNLVINNNWIITDAGLVCVDQLFITTWQTTTGNETITIPTNGSGYNYDIDWNGDNVFDDLGITGNATHTYPTAGVHTVKIRGDFPRIFFNLSGDRNKILSVEQWGNISWTSFNSAFLGCANLVVNAIDAPDLSNVTDLTIAFGLASSFNQSINHWDVSTITNMDRLFASATSFNQSLTSWDVSNVNQMTNTFAGASSFNQPLDSWNVSGVTTMRNMFFQASAFNQTLISWDVSAVTDMNAMFRSATAFDRNIGNWDISALTNVGSMFVNAGLSTGNYDSLLTGWSTLDAGETQIPANLNFHAGNSSYCAGATARNILTSSPYNWTITDAGLACIAPEITISLNAGKLSIIDTGVPNNEDLVLTTNNGKLTIQSSVAGLDVVNIPSAEYQGNDRVIIPLSVITDGLFIDGTDKEEGSVTLNIDHNFTTGDVEVINTTYIDQTGNLQTTTGIISLLSQGGTIIEGHLQTTTGKITLHGDYEYFDLLPIYGDLAAFGSATFNHKYGREGIYIAPTATITTVSGGIELYGAATRSNSSDEITRHGVHIAGSISSTGTGIVGIVDLQGLGQAQGNGSTGVFIKNATINVVDAPLTVWGIGGHSGRAAAIPGATGNIFNVIAPNHREGIFIDTATISSTGQGDLNFTGTSGPQIMFPVIPSQIERPFGSDAIEVRGATLISVIDSDVNMTGAISDYVDDPALTAYGAGINLPDTAKIYANGTGNINLTGTGQQTDNPLTFPPLSGDANVSSSSGIYMNAQSTSPTEIRAVDGTITINDYDAKHGWLFIDFINGALGGIIETVGTGDIIINAFASGFDNSVIGGPTDRGFVDTLVLGERLAGTISTVDGDIIFNAIGKDGFPARLTIQNQRDFRITGSGNFITSGNVLNLDTNNIFLNTGDINLKSDDLLTPCVTRS